MASTSRNSASKCFHRLAWLWPVGQFAIRQLSRSLATSTLLRAERPCESAEALRTADCRPRSRIPVARVATFGPSISGNASFQSKAFTFSRSAGCMSSNSVFCDSYFLLKKLSNSLPTNELPAANILIQRAKRFAWRNGVEPQRQLSDFDRFGINIRSVQIVRQMLRMIAS